MIPTENRIAIGNAVFLLIGESKYGVKGRLIQFTVFIAGYDILDTLDRIEQIADRSIVV